MRVSLLTVSLLMLCHIVPADAALIRYDFDINDFFPGTGSPPVSFDQIAGNAVVDVNLGTNTINSLVGVDLDIIGAPGSHFDGSNTGIVQSLNSVTIGGLPAGVGGLDPGVGGATDFRINFNIASGALNPTFPSNPASYVLSGVAGIWTANFGASSTVTARELVPEPASCFLMLFGFAGVCYLRLFRSMTLYR